MVVAEEEHDDIAEDEAVEEVLEVEVEDPSRTRTEQLDEVVDVELEQALHDQEQVKDSRARRGPGDGGRRCPTRAGARQGQQSLMRMWS